MNKYRVIYKDRTYQPQRRFMLFFWQNTTEPSAHYLTLDEAKEDIQQHKRIFDKELNRAKVVWEE